jgi:hypothetical protein
MLFSRVQVLNDNENGWLFSPLDILWLRYLCSDAPPSRVARGYWFARMACILGVMALKLSGIALQHNWELVGLSFFTVLGVGIALSRQRAGATQVHVVGDPTPAREPAYR